MSSSINMETSATFETAGVRFNLCLTTLTDELTPQGVVITELGLDHYYKHPNIDKKAIALMYTALQIIDKREGDLSPKR